MLGRIQRCGYAVPRESEPASLHPRGHRHRRLPATEPEGGVSAECSEITEHIRQFGRVSRSHPCGLEHRRRMIESVHPCRRMPAVPVGDPDARHEETRVARYGLCPSGFVPVRICGHDLGDPIGGQIRVVVSDGAEHLGDGVGGDRHQRRLHESKDRGLVVVGADDQRDLVREPLLEGCHWIARHDVSVDDRRKAKCPRNCRRDLVAERVTGGDQPGEMHIEQFTDVFPVDAHQLQEPRRHRGSAVGAVHRGRRRALHDRSLEQTLGLGRGHQRGDRRSPGGFTEHRHLIGIAAERRDALTDPLQCGNLISQPQIGLERVLVGGERGQVEEPERAETKIDGHHHHVAVLAEVSPVVDPLGGRSERVRTAMDPDQHRPQFCIGTGSPDVEREAVLGNRQRRIDRHRTVATLRSHRTEFEAVEHSRPGLQRTRRSEPELPHRRRRVGNTPPGQDRRRIGSDRIAENVAVGRAHEHGGIGLGGIGRAGVRGDGHGTSRSVVAQRTNINHPLGDDTHSVDARERRNRR